MNRSRVLIVDDHQVVADGLKHLLANRCEVVGTVPDGHLVAGAVSRLRPDVVLLDMSLPNVSGLEAMRQIRGSATSTQVIVLTMHADPRLAVEALRAGASGYVLKESSGEELVTAIEVVQRGGTYLAKAITRDVLTLMMDGADPGSVELTTHQCEVLRLVVRGLRAKEIGVNLALSTRTVEGIKYKMMQQLNVHSTADLVRYAVEHRLAAF